MSVFRPPNTHLFQALPKIMGMGLSRKLIKILPTKQTQRSRDYRRDWIKTPSTDRQLGINGPRYAFEVWARYAETKIHGTLKGINSWAYIINLIK